ncbi:hypothetical protein AAMO2058_000005100 [Amorphochlora amoebiformis]
MNALKVLKKKIKASRRRWRQGNADESKEADTKFDEMYQQYLGIESAMKLFREHVEGYCISLQESCRMQSTIAGDLLYFFDTVSSHRDGVKRYLNTSRSLDTSCAKFCDIVRDKVLKPLQKHIDLFPNVTKIVKKRNNKRIDYMSYQKQAEASFGKNLPRYQKKLAKMQRAEAVFNKINNDLSRVFQDYIINKEDMLDYYMHFVIDMQIQFFETAAENCEKTKDIMIAFERIALQAPNAFDAKLQQVVQGIEEYEESLAAGKVSNTNAYPNPSPKTNRNPNPNLGRPISDILRRRRRR